MKHKSIDQEIILSKCRDAVLTADPSAKIILYGSRARGDAGKESDYDLLIIVQNEVTLQKEDYYRNLLFPIELETGAVLTVIVIDETSWNSSLYMTMPFYKNVRHDGITL